MSEAREQCYERRDKYYRCAAAAAAAAAASTSTSAAAPPASATLPAAAVDAVATTAAATSSGPAPSCAAERSLYEAGCPRAWVRYWDERVKRGQPLKTPGA